MTDTPLAGPSDLEDRLGKVFTQDETQRAFALIDDASAAVRNYTRQLITEATDVAILEATAEQWLYLPERPVTAVTSVTAGGAPLAPGFWRLQNDALFRYDGWNTRFYGSSSVWNQPNTILVSYTHGYAEIPADIVRIVCKIAQTSWLNPQGLREYTMGQLHAVMAIETVGVGALDPDDKRILDFYRRPRRSVTLSADVL